MIMNHLVKLSLPDILFMLLTNMYNKNIFERKIIFDIHWEIYDNSDVKIYNLYMNGSTKMCQISLLCWKIWKNSTSSTYKKKYITHVRNDTIFYEFKPEIAV